MNCKPHVGQVKMWAVTKEHLPRGAGFPAGPQDARRALGAQGEEWAAAFLRDTGMTILARNWRCDLGEIDLVASVVAPDYSTGAEAAEWLVFVEVRTRRGHTFGTARDSVGPRKQAKLRALAQSYVDAVEWQGPWRIDVVAIQLMGNQPPQLEHIPSAVHGL